MDADRSQVASDRTRDQAYRCLQLGGVDALFGEKRQKVVMDGGQAATIVVPLPLSLLRCGAPNVM